MSKKKYNKPQLNPIVAQDADTAARDKFAVELVTNDGHGVILEARAGSPLTDPIEEEFAGTHLTWDPDFVMDPTGKPVKWYIKQASIQVDGLRCPHCGRKATMCGVIAEDPTDGQEYAVVQCGGCSAYLFVAIEKKEKQDNG